MDNVSAGYAGLWGRLAAHFVDVAITLSVLILHGVTFRILRAAGIWNPAGYGSASAAELWESYGALAKCAFVLAFVITSGLIYFPVFEASPWQATPGKRMLNIFVVRDNRTRASLGRTLGRWLAKWFFGFFGGSFVSMALIAGLPNQKAIHDYTAGTLVLSGRPAAQGPIEPWRFIVAFGIPFVWLLGTVYLIL